MTETDLKNKTAELLQAVHKNVAASVDAIMNLMPKVKDERLKSDMTVQLSVFEAFASRAAKLLAEEGVKPEDMGMLSKLSTKWSTMLSTLRDGSASHLAQLMIEGATMGANDLLRDLREAENSNVSERAMRLTRDVCAYEEQLARELKSYL